MTGHTLGLFGYCSLILFTSTLTADFHSRAPGNAADQDAHWINKRIIGGPIATSHLALSTCKVFVFPLGMKNSGKSLSEGSGVLVNFTGHNHRLAVLTAAHNFADPPGQSFVLSSRKHFTMLTTGEVGLQCGPRAGIRNDNFILLSMNPPGVVRLHSHFHGHREERNIYDMAIVLLSGPSVGVALSNAVLNLVHSGNWVFWPAETRHVDFPAGTECEMLGFGAFDNSGDTSEQPRAGRGKVMDEEHCGFLFERTKFAGYERFGDPYPHMCLRSVYTDRKRRNRLLPMHGDSGGPVFCPYAYGPAPEPGSPRRVQPYLAGIMVSSLFIGNGKEWQVPHAVVAPIWQRSLWIDFLSPALLEQPPL